MIVRRRVAPARFQVGRSARPRAAWVRSDWPLIAVSAAGGAAAAWVAILLWRRLDGLATGAHDLGFFQQVIWSVSATGAWVSSFHQGSFLGLHFSPILFVPAAIQGVVGADAHFLSLLHAVGIGFLVPTTFLFLRAALRPSPWAAALAAGIAVVLPVWAAIQWVIQSDFRPELAGLILALLAGWAGLTAQPRTMWLLAILALATREDVAYAVAVVGLVVAARGRGRMRRHGRALLIAAAAWGVVVFAVLMPWLRDGLASDTARYYRWLGQGVSILTAPLRIPDRIVGALTRQDPWFVFAGMVIAVVGLPLLRLRWLLLLVPPLAASLLSAHPPQAALILQYPLILLAPLLATAAMGGRRALAIAGHVRWRLRRTHGRADRPTGAKGSARWGPPVVFVLVATPGLLGAWVQGSIPPFDWGNPAFLGRPAAIAAMRAIATTVPWDAPLVADEGLVAPLAARPTIGQLTAPGLPTPEAFVIIDRQAWSPSGGSARRRELTLTELPTSDRPILADDGRFVLWGPEPAGATP